MRTKIRKWEASWYFRPIRVSQHAAVEQQLRAQKDVSLLNLFFVVVVVVFFYRVLPSFTGFYLVFIGFLGFLHGLAQFLVLRSAQRRLATEPLFLPSFTEFYRVLPSFTGFYWIWLGLTYFHGILPGIIKFFFVLLVFFSRFSLLGFAQFHWVASTFDRLYVTTTLVTSFNWFYWVSPHHNGFYPDFLGFLGFYLVLLGLNLIDWIVSISFFYRILMDSTPIYCVSY